MSPGYWCGTGGSTSVDLDSLDADNPNAVLSDLDPDILSETRRTVRSLKQRSPDAILQLVTLSKLYKKGRMFSRQDVRAVDSITLSGDRGTVVCVLVSR